MFGLHLQLMTMPAVHRFLTVNNVFVATMIVKRASHVRMSIVIDINIASEDLAK